MARITCGDIAPLVIKLLEDRRHPTGDQLHRSIFREALFLKSIVTQAIPDLGKDHGHTYICNLLTCLSTFAFKDIFEKEYSQITQRLQKDFSALLKSMDHLPSPRAVQCRREFGCLQVFTVTYTSHAGVKL